MTQEDLLDEVRAEMQKRFKALDGKEKDYEKQAEDWRKQVLGRFDQLQGRSGFHATESIATRFVGSSEYKAFVAGKGTAGTVKWTYEGKAVGTVVLGTPPTSIAEVSFAGPSLLPQFPATLRSLIPSRAMATESVLAVRESGSEGSAGEVCVEGVVKPQIDMKFVPEMFKLCVFAAWTKLSLQCLEDAGWVVSAIEQHIIKKIGQAEDSAWIAELVAAATAGPVGVVGDTALDLIAAAQDTLAAQGWAVTGTLVNPADLGSIRRVKDVNKTYIPVPSWIGPIVASPFVPATTFLTGAFSSAAEILDRDNVISIQQGTTNDDFIKNLRVILGERRAGLWIGQPSGFVKGSLIAPISVTAEAATEPSKARR